MRTEFGYECFAAINVSLRMKNCVFCTVLVIKFLTLSFSQTFAQADTVQRFERGRANEVSQQDKPYLISFSADGFCYDYADKFDSHNLKRLRDQGCYACH